MNANIYSKQKQRYSFRKLDLLDKCGSCCQECGYSKNISALHFVGASQQINSRLIANSKLSTLEAIVKGCFVLCSNCLAEKDNPDMKADIIKSAKNPYISADGEILF